MRSFKNKAERCENGAGPKRGNLPQQTFRLFRHVPCVDGSELEGESSRRKAWSVRPYVRPFSAVRMTAGHNALRGSGPGQKLAFDDALYLLCRIVGDTPGKFGNLNQFPQGAVSSGRDSGVGQG